jgi:hypothetical protein
MSSQWELLYRLITWTAMTLATFLVAIPARAQSKGVDYLFFVGSGFLCQPNDSSACPTVTMSAGDSTYELSGAGRFNMKNKSVMATGTFTRKSSNGNSLETGIWMANELVSFVSYGIAPGDLLREGEAFGLAPLAPRRLPMSTAPMPTGGLAIFRIRLLPTSGVGRTAVLEVNCAIGKVPEDRPTDGVRLIFEGGGDEFDREISGRTMFVLARPGSVPAPKLPAAEGEPKSAPAEARQ